MKLTIEIPDQLVADAIAAANRINDRQAEGMRQPGPLTFGQAEARDCATQFLQNLLLSDIRQAHEVQAERDIRDKQAAIATQLQAAPLTPPAAGGSVGP